MLVVLLNLNTGTHVMLWNESINDLVTLRKVISNGQTIAKKTNVKIQLNEAVVEKNTPLQGIEPWIFSLGGKHLIHSATGAFIIFRRLSY